MAIYSNGKKVRAIAYNNGAGNRIIGEVWQDGKRTYAMPKGVRYESSAVGRFSHNIPAWADYLTVIAGGGAGGGQAGDGGYGNAGTRGQEGTVRTAHLKLRNSNGERSYQRVYADIAAGGSGGDGKPSRTGGDGGTTTVTYVTHNGVNVQLLAATGGKGGGNNFSSSQASVQNVLYNDDLRGVAQSEYPLKLPQWTGAGGNGGILGNYQYGTVGGNGFAIFIFTRAIGVDQSY